MSIVTNQTIDLPEDGLEAGGYDPVRAATRKFFGGWTDERRVDDVVEEWVMSPSIKPEIAGSVSDDEMDEDVDLSS